MQLQKELQSTNYLVLKVDSKCPEPSLKWGGPTYYYSPEFYYSTNKVGTYAYHFPPTAKNITDYLIQF